MDYELAKELKDAGFPLRSASMEDGKDSIRKHQMFSHGLDSIGRAGIWLYPTLEQLIAASGDKLKSLEQNHTAKWDWWATAYNDGAIVCGGKRPEEAIARLWLAINAKAV